MDWKETKDLLMVALIVLVACCVTSRCSYDAGRADERTELVQELCSKSVYDFCVKVPRKPVYVLKGENEMSELKTAEKLYDECFHLIQDNRHLTEKNELLELRMNLIRKVSQMSEQDLLDLNFALELVKQTNMLNEIEVAKDNKDFYERTSQTPVSNSKS